ncbi:hypothetical protein [Pontibacter sp. BAB1700]|uniref:hypothetical protein n=1 Tax=Pontibacter sp. BAB1700 TaxID=1144253 RepID=UPI00026BD1FF|nr:hypothetical protein [Pontibacter sp. BAB1700]EJF10061.1 hypothetical protein O71_11154 [Pontibacter sp. BAB1700]
MTGVLIAILFLLIISIALEVFARLKSTGKYRIVSVVVLVLSTAYFLLLLLFSFVGMESSPVWVKTSNNYTEGLKVYHITVYDHPVYDGRSRFVSKGATLKPNESSTTVLEIDGCVAFWTIAVNTDNLLVYFKAYNSPRVKPYHDLINDNTIEDGSLAKIALDDIEQYERETFAHKTLIVIDLLLLVALIALVLTSKKLKSSSAIKV